MQILKYIFIGLLIFLTCGCGGKKKQGEFRYFRNYQRTFNDLNDKHLKAARQWGIQPVTSDELLEEQMGKLDKIGSCRYYQVDELTHSIPYLVPRAEKLLKTIGRNFQDSLSSKGLSSRKIIVTNNRECEKVAEEKCECQCQLSSCLWNYFRCCICPLQRSRKRRNR